MDNFENSIRHKLDDANLNPPSNMWSRIEAELPEKKKRRALIWMMWLLPFCLIGGITIYYINTQDENIQLTKNSKVPSNLNLNNDIVSSNITPPSDVNSNSSNQLAANNQPSGNIRHAAFVQGNGGTHFPTPADIANTDLNNEYIDLGNLKNIKKLNLFASNFKDETPSNNRVNPYQTPKNEIPNDNGKKRNNRPFNCAVEAVNNIYYSGRFLNTSSNATADQKNYVKVRNSIEKGNLNWSGGIAFKVCIAKHLMVGTGIRLTEYSEDLIYNKRDVNVAFEAPPIGIDEIVKKKYPYTFTKQTDSIYAGQNFYGGTNYYFFREVPITFGYYHYGKKFNYFFEPAISYCRITYIKTSLLDLDHVGFTTVNQIDGYQGVSHIFNASLRMGGGVNLSKSFSLVGGLYASRAITPLINYGYAKQLPYTCGITLGFEGRF